ncbi:MAG: 4Fe-4S dicluster domain-containing protein [Clostridium sp.]|nr:4Fe-4S dicluster domain-containing protein [Clostridium sp.]
MNNQYPIYTLKNECVDCYKCVRQCHMKAIRIENGHASVIPEKCIACGHCVLICPAEAKKIRNDINRARAVLTAKKRVFVSLAPSWAGFFECGSEKFITALKKLGFEGVSETALGAQEVSIEVTKILSKREKKIHISSACPAIVDYVRLYMPEYTKFITPVASPALTHAKLLKKRYGDDIGVIFVGPCIAKKNEADRNPELIDVSLTFHELVEWFNQENVDFNNVEVPEDERELKFVPKKAYEGAYYPIEGGMNKTIRLSGCEKDIQLVSVSSIPAFKESLENINPDEIDRPIFVEALACAGGCANGPCKDHKKPGILTMSDILRTVKLRDDIPSEPEVVVAKEYRERPQNTRKYTPEEISEAMASIGKHGAEDELNCGGCGYDTCRQLAEALLSGDAEPSMCVSYMRKLAIRKASAMLRSMPSAIVMADADLRIIETNEAFVRMFAPDLVEIFNGRPEGLAGGALDRVIPFVDLFKRTLKSGKDIHKERYPVGKNLYDIAVFEIERNKIVGAVITDVTKTEMKREQIAKKAHEVIEKNIATVQNIACLLGEHMVDTELLLSQIAQGYEETHEEDDEAGEK